MQTYKFKITKRFLGGILKGITIEEYTNVKFEPGFVCEKPVGGSPYKIIAVETLAFPLPKWS